MTATSHPRPRRKFLVAALAILLGLCLAEGGLRLVLRLGGGPYDREALERELALQVDALSEEGGELGPEPGPEDPGERDFAFLHPFLGYETRRGFQQLAEQDAFRREVWPKLPVEERPFIVAVFGGSVALLFAEPDRGGVERFVQLLKADPRLAGREVFVLAHGRQAFKQPQQTMLLAYLFSLGFTFDAVVNLDGFNEVAFGLQNVEYDVHPSHPSHHHSGHLLAGLGADADLDGLLALRESAEQARTFVERARAWGLTHSAVGGSLARWRARRLREEWLAAREALRRSGDTSDPPPNRGERGLAYPDDPAAVIDDVVAGWAASSRSMRALCAERDVTYLHVLQPTLFDIGSKPLAPEEEAFLETSDDTRAAAEGVRLGYPKLRAAGERLRAESVPFHDASQLFGEVEEALYYDFCHFGAEGNALLATELARALLAELP